MAASALIANPLPVPSATHRLSYEQVSLKQKPIQVFVAIVGEDSPMVPLEVAKLDTIVSIKLRIQAHKGHYVDQQRLVYGGKELEQDDLLLQDYGVSHGDVLHMVMRTHDLVSLTLKTVNGGSFVYKVRQVESSKDLHKFITEKDGPSSLGLPLVILKGEHLEDQAVVEEFSLRGESVLLLRVHKPRLRSKFLSQKELEIVVTSLNDVHAQNASVNVVKGSVDLNDAHAQNTSVDVDCKNASYLGSKIGRQERIVPQLTYGLTQPARQLLLLKYPISFDHPYTITELIDHVKMGLHAGEVPELTSEGSGGVYLMKDECGLHNVGVFKPMDEEPMSVNNPRGFSVSNYGEGLKKGTRSGEGAIKEVAAYILDHPATGSRSRTRGDVAKRVVEGFAGVPPTTMVKCYHEAFHHGSDGHVLLKTKKGSLQRFVHALSSCEDMGSSMFPVDEVHKISVLDLRLANTDRNGGNILVSKGNDGTLKLVPIDHGYCLPDKFEDCSFEWLYWPQAQQLYGPSTLEYIESLDAEEDLALLWHCGWGLRPQVARVFRISTMLLKKGAAAGLSSFEIGSIMSRSGCLDSKSPIEGILEKAEAMNLKEQDFLKAVANLVDEHITMVRH